MPDLLKDFVLSVRNKYRKRYGQPDPIDNEVGLLSSNGTQPNDNQSCFESMITKTKITSRKVNG